MREIPSVSVAFFDLDDTITSTDTNKLWIMWRMRHELKGWGEYAIGVYLQYFYKRGKLRPSMMDFYYRYRIGGMSSADYSAKAECFFSQSGKSFIIPEMKSLAEKHREKGHTLVMITGQDNVVAKPFADHLGMELISNELIIRKEKFSHFAKPTCYAEGKVVKASEYLARENLLFDDAAFYSDSISDLPLLEKVAYPCAVNPDIFLKEEALKRGWPVIEII